jgi:hypothetical protein
MTNEGVLSQELTARYAAWTGLMVVNGLIFSSAFGVLAQAPAHHQGYAILIALLGAVGVLLPLVAFASISSAFEAIRKLGCSVGADVNAQDPDPLKVFVRRRRIKIYEAASALMVLASMLCLLVFVIRVYATA